MKNERIPELYLEQALLGELPEGKKELTGSEQAAVRLEELKASNREILSQYDPEETARRIGIRLESTGREESPAFLRPAWFSQHRVGVLLAAAALAVVAGTSLFLFRESPVVEPAAPGIEITRIKGMDPAISLYRKSENSVERLVDGAAAREFDLIQISYNAAGKPFGAIFSIDGRGVVSLHLPGERRGSLVLRREGEVALDFSYRLDDAPGFERFFFVTSDRTFDLDLVLKRVDKLSAELMKGKVDPAGAPLELPDGLEYTSLTVKKEVSK